MDALLALLATGELPPPRPVELGRTLQLPPAEIRRLMNLLQAEHAIVVLSPEVLLPPARLDPVLAALRALASGLPEGRFSVSQAGTCLDAPRRFTVPLLEYLDREGITERLENDRRFLS
jgi:DNA-binding IclR family transcriptional regulator